MGMGTNFGSKQTLDIHRTTDPSAALSEVLAQNAQLKHNNLALQEQLRQNAESQQMLVQENSQLAQFRQILQNPIEKFSVEFSDLELLRQLRARMIDIFGAGGQMDSEGRWAQGVVNHRFQLVVRQLMHNGLQRWPQVKAQVNEIIQLQGLMTR